MKIMSLVLVGFLMMSLVAAQSYNSNIDLSGYGVDGNVKADVNVKNVQVGADGSVKADIDVKSDFQGKVDGKDVKSGSSGNYSIDAKAGEKAKIKAGIRDEKGKVIAQKVREYDWKNIRAGERINLSNGRNAEVKVMPSTASATAIARLKIKVCSEENNCTIVLKETGKGNETKLSYEVKVKKEFKILGLFKSKKEVNAEVDADSGNVTKIRRPWWSFIASESKE